MKDTDCKEILKNTDPKKLNKDEVRKMLGLTYNVLAGVCVSQNTTRPVSYVYVRDVFLGKESVDWIRRKIVRQFNIRLEELGLSIRYTEKDLWGADVN